MELALSLGDSAKPFSFLAKTTNIPSKDHLGFGIALDGGLRYAEASSDSRSVIGTDAFQAGDNTRALSDPPQLDLLPLSPVPPAHQPSSNLPIPWLTDALTVAERASSDRLTRGSDVNQPSAMRTEEAVDDGAALSSPSSAVLSSLQIDFCIGSSGGNVERGKREHEVDAERTSSRTWSDEDENGSTRKKLRLSKEQSAYLEESFKEHTTLNPKQKLALAKQLNLRPRQVEVWFQNRRARTKLKQTEVDCEYLKRCCETLTEENRRLQKELQELRALKTSQPFYKQHPATTLTMCPSCERVATHSSASVAATGVAASQTQPPKMTYMATSTRNSS